jgi:hypothetical protein
MRRRLFPTCTICRAPSEYLVDGDRRCREHRFQVCMKCGKFDIRGSLMGWQRVDHDMAVCYPGCRV